MTPLQRNFVLFFAISALLFDGFELGLMPVASLSVTQSLLGDHYTKKIGADWFAWYTAALMLGAAVGGWGLGRLGDVLGRSKALGISVLFYSVFAGLGSWVQTQDQMLGLRFLVGLGVGGVWPNAVALATECWPDKSKPMVAGLLGAALNVGILMLSQVANVWPITPSSWRWLFNLAALPAILGCAALILLPESPSWLATRKIKNDTTDKSGNNTALSELFLPPLLRVTLLGILLGSIPLVGAWAASKWMIPWADSVAKDIQPGYKAIVQGWWAMGAVLGSFSGAQIASLLGKRTAYAVISIGATSLTLLMFLGSEPLKPMFLWIVFAQAFVSTLFFGWLPLYLPSMFPTRVRAAGSGIAFNTGRFVTAGGVLVAGALFAKLNSYPLVGAWGSLIYGLGAIAIWFVQDEAVESPKPKS